MSRLPQILVVIPVLGLSPALTYAQQDDAHAHHNNAAPAEQVEAVNHAVDQSLQHTGGDTLSAPPVSHDHQAAFVETGNAITELSSTSQQAPGSLRDPHAYSEGFELSSGLYTLETESQIKLADQTIFTGLWMDRFEYVGKDGNDATELEGHAWIGNSYNRVLLRTEASAVDGSLEDAEIDLMLSRAVSPFWDLQFGLRHQIVEDAHRHWAVIGLNGIAPYWFEVDASLFVTEHGQTFYDLEAEYEMRLTQRLVLQPRIDIHSYGKSDVELGHGSGLSKVKFGARLRYEFSRQFAPYLGLERVSSFGETADLLPPEVDRNETWWLVGLKFWF